MLMSINLPKSLHEYPRELRRNTTVVVQRPQRGVPGVITRPSAFPLLPGPQLFLFEISAVLTFKIVQFREDS